MLFDSHTHVQFPEFDADRDAVVKRALEAGIWMVNVGTNVESSKKAVELAYKYKEGVYATVGIHPIRDEVSIRVDAHDAEVEMGSDPEYFARIEELAQDPKVVGIGETGLDYFRSSEAETRKSKVESDKERQKELFVKHIELAKKVNKPLIIHCRDAHEDLLNLLLATRYSLPARPGVMHFFGGEGAWENLDKYLEMGFYISLAGVITFRKYGHLEDIKRIPLNRMLIETDAPYVAPEPHRGKRNEPLYVKLVAEKLVEIKEINFEDVAERTTLNAKKIFHL